MTECHPPRRPVSPEARAAKVVGKWRQSRRDGQTLSLRALIADAIREAEECSRRPENER